MSNELGANCSICQHSYDEGGICQGLLLPCGHPFCRYCLQKLEDNCNKKCPMCNHDWSNARVSVLPEYILDGGAASGEGEEEEGEVICKKHGFELILWCQSCEVSTCKCCIKEDHQKCEWVMLEDSLYAINKLVKQNVERASSKLLTALVGVVERKAKCSKELASMSYLIAEIEESERQLLAYSNKLASVESKMNRGIEELRKTGETAENLSIHDMQRSKRRVEQLAKDVDVPESPELLMSDFFKAYTELEDICAGENFLPELSSEFLRRSKDTEPLAVEEEEPPQAEVAVGGQSRNPSTPAVKITAEIVTLVEDEKLKDEEGNAPIKAELPEGGDWDIADPDTASVAVTRLLTTRVRPSCLTVTVNAIWHQTQVTNLLKVVGHKSCSVRLKFFDTFMLLEDEGEKKDEERLKALRFGDHKCVIEEYWGCLSLNMLEKFLASPALKTLALPLSSAGDAKVLTALQSRHEEEGLSELHLHLSMRIKVEQVAPLDVSRLKNLSRLYLHCHLVNGSHLSWLVLVLDKLVSPEARKKWSVVLSLPRNSLTAADLDRLLGLFRDYCLTNFTLQLDSDMSLSQRMDISQHCRKSCRCILWYTEYSLPLNKNLPSDTVSSCLTRTTLPVLLTLDDAKELLEKVLTPLNLSQLKQKIDEIISTVSYLTRFPMHTTQFECPNCNSYIDYLRYSIDARRYELHLNGIATLRTQFVSKLEALHHDLQRLSQFLEQFPALAAISVAAIGS